MKKILIGILLFGLGMVSGYLGYTYFFSKDKINLPDSGYLTEGETNNEYKGEPVFEWSYKSFEDEEIPRSTIYLRALYEDGSEVTKEIDTIQGGCNDYTETDADVYAGSSMIICYYAGLGNYYKVVNVGDEYQVQRRTFEEAGPDYNPPVQTFETIVRF